MGREQGGGGAAGRSDRSMPPVFFDAVEQRCCTAGMSIGLFRSSHLSATAQSLFAHYLAEYGDGESFLSG
jgi:hypothetical protein